MKNKISAASVRENPEDMYKYISQEFVRLGVDSITFGILERLYKQAVKQTESSEPHRSPYKRNGKYFYYCRDCSEIINNTFKFCPFCGKKQNWKKEQTK